MMTDTAIKTPKKRKSGVGLPQSGKKQKLNGVPKAGKVSPNKNTTEGKLTPFGGTKKLRNNNKKPKTPAQNKTTTVQQNEPKQNIEADTPQQTKKREKKRKGQFVNLSVLVKGDDESKKSAIEQINKRIEAIESRPEKSKTAQKKLKILKRLKNFAEGKSATVKDESGDNLKKNQAKRARKGELKKKAEGEAQQQKKKPGQTQKQPKVKQEAVEKEEDNNEESDESEESEEQVEVERKGKALQTKKTEVEEEEDGSEESDESEEQVEVKPKGKMPQTKKMELKKDEEDSDEEVEENESDEDAEEEEESEEDEEDDDDEKEEDENDDEDESEEEDEEEKPAPKPIPKPCPKSKKGNPAVKEYKELSNTPQQNIKLEDLEQNNLLKRDQKRYVLFVGNIPFDTTKGDLLEHFQKAGKIVHIRIPTEKGSNKPRGFAYVEVQDNVTYQKCLSMHHSFLKNRRINILYTQSGKKKSDDKKKEVKAKNLKLHALRKQGKLAGSMKETNKRSFRRNKKKQSNNAQQTN